MADTLLLRAVKAQPTSVNLSSKKLESVPKIISKLYKLQNLQLRNNRISELPKEICSLQKLTLINLGNNELHSLPAALAELSNLEILHLFDNSIQQLDGRVLGGLKNLKLLNVNNNKLKSLPSEINRLLQLKHLSLDGNQLATLPSELCALSRLEELHVANNQLTSLPLEMGFLAKLKKLHLQKNKIKDLPEGISKCGCLEVVDVAGNEMRIFPSEMNKLPLRELYCEENPLLDQLPVQSIQEDEVLTLKELTARYIVKQLKERQILLKIGEDYFYRDNPAWSFMRNAIKHYPDIREMMTQASKCALCGGAFFNTWLECVCFINAHRELRLKNSLGVIPVRALLCSYKCFNTPGHNFFGVAFPQ